MLKANIDDVGKGITEVAKEPDALTRDEQHRLDCDFKRATIESFTQDIGERRTYARGVFRLIVGWLISIFLLLLLQGFDCVPFQLSDSVILAIVGGTTLNVLGLFVIVVNYLFNKSSTR